MHSLTVQLGARSYPILIGSGLIDSTELLTQHLPQRDVLLVSNTVVAPLYAARLQQALPNQRIVEAVLPDGERHKTLESAARLFDVLIANRMGRDALVLALGGGVVGDLAGFVAACYQRGVALAQIPTTLLAQVDSSVGGKTAVNHPGGKNLIGAFHQPEVVIADTALLNTLPDRELTAGLAEVIKYGLIRDAGFFDWIEQHIEALRARSGGAGTCDLPLVRDQGRDRRARRARAGRARAAESGPHLRPCDRDGHRLPRVAAWRGGGRRHVDRGRSVRALGSTAGHSRAARALVAAPGGTADRAAAARRRVRARAHGSRQKGASRPRAAGTADRARSRLRERRLSRQRPAADAGGALRLADGRRRACAVRGRRQSLARPPLQRAAAAIPERISARSRSHHSLQRLSASGL